MKRKDISVASHMISNWRRTSRYLIVAILPLIVCWLLITHQSKKWSRSIVEENAIGMLAKNTEIINQYFASLEQSLYALINDAAFNDLLASTSYNKPILYHLNRREIVPIISQYFWDFEGFCSFYIVSDQCSYSFYNSTGLPEIITKNSIVHLDDIKQRGKNIIWFPTTRYDDMIRISDRYSKYYSNHNVLSLGLQMDLVYWRKNIMYKYTTSNDPPVLLISIFSSIFDKWLSSQGIISDVYYSIYTDKGELIYQCSNFPWDSSNDFIRIIPADADDNMIERRQLFLNQQEVLACSNRIRKNNWIITSYTPINNANVFFSNSINFITLLLIMLAIILVLVVVRLTMREISIPLSLLCTGLKKTSAGNYQHQIKAPQYPSYQSTFAEYNQMNRHIEQLIRENYESKIMEKELEIQMLNMQFNPHFMYNMLNIISLTALENGSDNISEMLSKLSYMMRYSAGTTSPFVLLQEELNYIDIYVKTIQLRKQCIFTYKVNIDSYLLDSTIPKFMLQPFVENAVKHGFSGIPPESGYQLTVSAQREDKDLLFFVEDNGGLFEEKTVETLWHSEKAGIGISNTSRRIQLYYGKNYGVSIFIEPKIRTRITIRIPFVSVKRPLSPCTLPAH